MVKPKLYVAKEGDILEGRITDIYFVRTKKILEEKGLTDVKVRMEIHTGGLPRNYDWAVYAGLEEALKILEGKPLNVYSIPEGTLVTGDFPVMIIEGRYYDVCEFETALLGVLRHETSVATRAARFKKLAGGKVIFYFGLRGAHPAIAPMLDRATFIGGVDAVSGTASATFIEVEPKGTMPHALIIVFKDQVKAWRAFDEVVEEGVPRILLIDTFDDERVEALKAVEALGNRIYGLRLDTPKSRRGNIRSIIEEIKWTLKLLGHDNVRIVLSGGISEGTVRELRDIVDIFGVGTSITYPEPIDMSMDIVEIFEGGRWRPFSKRGKKPGAKRVYRCGTLDYEIIHWDFKPSKCAEDIMIQWMRDGELIRDLPHPKEIREYVLRQLEEVPEPTPI